MRRLKDYARFLTWNFGLSYIALWMMTFWTFDYGPDVFGHSGVCRPGPHTVLFYWVCERGSPFAILAALANTALTLTVWGPVYIAATSLHWDAMMIAAPIVGLHLLGLATAILITTRTMLALFQVVRRIFRGNAAPQADMLIRGMPAISPAVEPYLPRVSRRDVFGLRGVAKG